MKIAIAGMGYVGLSQAVLLAQHNSVCVVDVAAEKVNMLNRGISPIQDSYLDAYLNKPHLRLRATLDPEDGYSGAEYVVIAVPTDFNPRENAFDTAMVESVIRQVLRYAPEAVMVIKSTVPVGFTQSMQSKYPAGHILVSPEFLREGKALYDNLYPSRIIVGTDLADPVLTEQAHAFARLLQDGAEKKNVELLVTGCGEAETIKLFANTYLALRMAFSTNWTPSLSCAGWTRAPSSTGSARIPGSASITTTPPSATAATVCQRIPASCWPAAGRRPRR